MFQEKCRERVDDVILSPQASITDAIEHLDRAGTGALLLCEEDRKLYGLLTDGDIRRAFLRGVSFSSPCGAVACRDPIVASSERHPN